MLTWAPDRVLYDGRGEKAHNRAVRRDFGRLVLLGLLPIFAVAAGAGCALLRADTQPQMPELDVPPPPPRVFTAAATESPPGPTTATDAAPADRAPQRPPAARPEPPPEPPKAPPPARAEHESEPEPARPEDPRAGRTLQTPESSAESDRAIRNRLTRASGNLQRVNYQGLSASLKEQYDIAKRFIKQADDALKAKNLVYASTLADKAVEISEVLPRR
jgi:hypothetical protein